MPDVALVDVHLSRLRKVEVFGPDVTVVDNEPYFTPDTVTPKPVLAAVIYMISPAMSRRTIALLRIFSRSPTSSKVASVS